MFTKAELESYRDSEVDDLLGESPKLVFVGINPGLWTAATNTHFAHPSNRFYPALELAGITPPNVDADRLRSDGHDPATRAALTDRGLAITNVVARATARASELTRDELRAGGEVVARKVSDWRPRVVGFVGITAYRDAYRRSASMGRQPRDEWVAGIETWALPNPSGLNAHWTTDSLARAYREVAEAAGLRLDEPRW